MDNPEVAARLAAAKEAAAKLNAQYTAAGGQVAAALASMPTAPKTLPSGPAIYDRMYVGVPPVHDGTFSTVYKVCGPDNSYLEHITKETKVRLSLRGQGSGYRDPDSGRESFEPLHIHFMTNDQTALAAAKALASHLLATVKADYDAYLSTLGWSAGGGEGGAVGGAVGGGDVAGQGQTVAHHGQTQAQVPPAAQFPAPYTGQPPPTSQQAEQQGQQPQTQPQAQHYTQVPQQQQPQAAQSLGGGYPQPYATAATPYPTHAVAAPPGGAAYAGGLPPGGYAYAGFESLAPQSLAPAGGAAYGVHPYYQQQQHYQPQVVVDARGKPVYNAAPFAYPDAGGGGGGGGDGGRRRRYERERGGRDRDRDRDPARGGRRSRSPPRRYRRSRSRSPSRSRSRSPRRRYRRSRSRSKSRSRSPPQRRRKRRFVEKSFDSSGVDADDPLLVHNKSNKDSKPAAADDAPAVIIHSEAKLDAAVEARKRAPPPPPPKRKVPPPPPRRSQEPVEEVKPDSPKVSLVPYGSDDDDDDDEGSDVGVGGGLFSGSKPPSPPRPSGGNKPFWM